MNGNSGWPLAGWKVRNMVARLSSLTKVGLAALAVAVGAQSALAAWEFGQHNDPYGTYTTLQEQDPNGWILEVIVSGGGFSIERTIQGAAGALALPSTVWNEDLGYNCTLLSINGYAFSYEEMTSVSIPSSVDWIDYYAFEGCPFLTTVVFEGSPYLEYGAFRNCGNLVSLTFKMTPSSFYNQEVFLGCSGSAVINIYSQYVTEWSDWLDHGSFTDNTAISVFISNLHTGNIWIPFNVLDLGWNWVLDWEGGVVGSTTLSCLAKNWILDVWVDDYNDTLQITGVIQEGDPDLFLPPNVLNDTENTFSLFRFASIDTSAFSNTSITSVQIPEVTVIEGYAFAGCHSLTDVVFYASSGDMSIAYGAFQNCENLVSLTFSGPPPSFWDYEVFFGCDSSAVINIDSQYLAEWSNWLDHGSFTDNTAISVFLSARHTGDIWIPFNILNFVPLNQEYTVTFNGNGADGGATAIMTITLDSPVTLTLNGFNRSGHKFLGWALSSSATVSTYADGVALTAPQVNALIAQATGGSVVLYAVWEITGPNPDDAIPVITDIQIVGSTLTITAANCMATSKTYKLLGTSDLAVPFTLVGSVQVAGSTLTGGAWVINNVPATAEKFFFKVVSE